jgi:hypothetical protein
MTVKKLQYKKLTDKLKLNVISRYAKLKNKIQSGFKKIILALRSTPAWVKIRPQAIKLWMKENRKKRKYHSFKLEKKLQPDYRDIPNSWQLTKDSFKFYLNNYSTFLGIIFIQAILYVALVHGPTSFNLKEAQDTIKAFFGGNGTSASSTFALLGSVVGAQTQRDGAAIYNFLIYLVISLADIWVIRSLMAKKAFKIRDAFYSGMTPVIPVLVTLVVMTVQLLPFTITSYIYTVGRTNGVFISGIEDLSFFLLALASGLLSFYLITPSALSLYAVTLPNMYPLRTITLTKQIVKFRRFVIFRRVVALPLIVAFIFFSILLLLIRFYPQSGIWFVQVFPVFILPLVHIYLFKLYRSLI